MSKNYRDRATVHSDLIAAQAAAQRVMTRMLQATQVVAGLKAAADLAPEGSATRVVADARVATHVATVNRLASDLDVAQRRVEQLTTLLNLIDKPTADLTLADNYKGASIINALEREDRITAGRDPAKDAALDEIAAKAYAAMGGKNATDEDHREATRHNGVTPPRSTEDAE